MDVYVELKAVQTYLKRIILHIRFSSYLFRTQKIYLAFNVYFALDFIEKFFLSLPNWVEFMDNAEIKCLSTRERYELSPFIIWKSI